MPLKLLMYSHAHTKKLSNKYKHKKVYKEEDKYLRELRIAQESL